MFTCAGRRVALLEAFRSAMDELGVAGELIATDTTITSSAFQKADRGLETPRVGSVDYIATLLDFVRKYGVGLLVPLTDLDLRVLSRHGDEFAEAGCTVMIGDEAIVSLCRDKIRTNGLLERAGLIPIRTLTLNDFRAEPFYPCFVKPERGSGGVGTAVIRDEKHLHTHVGTFGERLIVQEYVPGQEFTIDVYRSRDGQVRCVVPRQRLVIRSGEVEKGITVKDDGLIESVVRLGSLLENLWGVYCCQCRRDPAGSPRFFEINPRFGGGVPLSIAAGANLPLYLIQEVLGLPLTAEIGNFTDHLLMLRYDDALFMRIDDPSQLPGYNDPIVR